MGDIPTSRRPATCWSAFRTLTRQTGSPDSLRSLGVKQPYSTEHCSYTPPIRSARTTQISCQSPPLMGDIPTSRRQATCWSAFLALTVQLKSLNNLDTHEDAEPYADKHWSSTPPMRNAEPPRSAARDPPDEGPIAIRSTK